LLPSQAKYMKYSHLILSLALVIALDSCKKKSQEDSTPSPAATVHDGISYPDSVYYGRNILSLTDSTDLTASPIFYGLGGNLEDDASLKIVLINYPVLDTASGHISEWFYADETGWLISNYDDTLNTQTFTAIQHGKIDVDIQFVDYGHGGSCRVDFYENSSTVTRSKFFTWH
jgi:hypothetical protein